MLKMFLTLPQVMAKSAEKIATLQEPLRTAARLLVENCYARGIMIVITSGYRSYAEQNRLYAQSRSRKDLDEVGLFDVKANPGADHVTNARGGYSNHNFGFSFDAALLLPNGVTVSWDTRRSDNLDSLPDWSEMVIEGKKLGLEWGGDWRSFVDMSHFQMVFGLTTTQFRNGARPSAGQITKALLGMKGAVAVTPPAAVIEKEVSTAYPFVVGGKTSENLAFVYGNTGISYVPMRDLAEFVGVPYFWDNVEKRAFFNATEQQAASGEKKPLDDVRLIDGRVYVQLRPLATAYGKKPDFKEKRVIVA